MLRFYLYDTHKSRRLILLYLSQIIDAVDNILWSYFGIAFVLFMGIYFTWRFKFGQLTKFYPVCRDFFISWVHPNSKGEKGVHPIKAFFTSIGGCIGIGNVVAVCTAIKIGGPGALFWIWITAFFGMLFKYSEVYLGMRYRVKNPDSSFDGGPMFFLQQVFKGSVLPILAALLLAVYGTEVYMFNTLTEVFVDSWHWPKWFAVLALVVAVVGVGIGGVSRVGTICGAIMPLFLVIFVTMCSWILFKNAANIPGVISTVFSSAFLGHAPLGGFAGSSIMLAASQGIARGCYTGDIGVGFASVIHAESSATDSKKQASFAIFGVFLDTFVVCTMSILVVLSTGLWSSELPASKMVHQALATEFSSMSFFMPMFIILLGYSSMISFYCVGQKCVKFVFPKRGAFIYSAYATASFLVFSTVEPHVALSVMSIAGALLLIINSVGIFRLRKKIEFI